VSRDDLNGPEHAELAALDRILAREPVGEEHLELAALVESVRAGAPRMDPAFRERLDGELARRRARRRFPSVTHRLAFAGGGLVAAAVALTVVISSGILNGAAKRVPPPLALPATHTFGAVAGGTASSAPVARAAPAAGAAPSAGASSRLVHRSSSLTLATPASAMSRVATRIVAATEQRGGVVASSRVYEQGASSSASFSLQVPSGRLGSLIAALSSLASVRALNQSTADITGTYDDAVAVLATRRAERAALLTSLAHAATAAQATALQAQIDRVDRRIAAQVRAIAAIRNQAQTATLAVYVMTAAAVAHHSGGGSGGPISRAFHDALHALDEILAVALVVLAIVLPFAITGLALWWSGSALRQRARERALRGAT